VNTQVNSLELSLSFHTPSVATGYRLVVLASSQHVASVRIVESASDISVRTYGIHAERFIFTFITV
jgi:hypothetical protein